MIQRGGEVVIRMLENIQQVTIEPIVRATIAPATLIYTNEYTIYAAWRNGATAIKAFVIVLVNMPEMRMGTDFAKCMSTPWRVLVVVTLLAETPLRALTRQIASLSGIL